MLDLTIDSQGLEHAVARAKHRGVVLPTFAQMADPTKVPGGGRATWPAEPVPACQDRTGLRQPGSVEEGQAAHWRSSPARSRQ